MFRIPFFRKLPSCNRLTNFQEIRTRVGQYVPVSKTVYLYWFSTWSVFAALERSRVWFPRRSQNRKNPFQLFSRFKNSIMRVARIHNIPKLNPPKVLCKKIWVSHEIKHRAKRAISFLLGITGKKFSFCVCVCEWERDRGSDQTLRSILTEFSHRGSSV